MLYTFKVLKKENDSNVKNMNFCVEYQEISHLKLVGYTFWEKFERKLLNGLKISSS